MRNSRERIDLPRDPTQRITLPPPEERDTPNAITPEQLDVFLETARKRYPRQYAFLATLAYTELRFCHARALRWEDVDEATGVILVQRKQANRNVGPLSRKKRAPTEYPLVPELAMILREHKQRMEEGREGR